MKAIILIGGLGTRLRPLTLSQPKALLPVLNRPFLSYQFSLLKEVGVQDVMLASGKAVRPWESEFRRCAGGDLRIHFAHEPMPLGTGGAIRYAFDVFQKKQKLKINESILIFNGDVFFDFNLKKFINFHQDSHSDASILLTRVKEPSQFGVVALSQTGRVKKFVEKPKTLAYGNLINAGAYLVNTSWVLKIPPNKVISVERDVFPLSLQRKDRVSGYRMNGYWNDIGTPKTYLEAHHDLVTRPNRWTGQKVLRKRGSSGLIHLVADKSARFSHNTVFAGMVTLGSKVRVMENTTISDTILMDNSVVKKGAVIKGSIIGRNCHIGEFSTVGEGSILGEGTFLPPYSRC